MHRRSGSTGSPLTKNVVAMALLLAAPGVQAEATAAPAIDIASLAAGAAARFPQPVRVGTLLGRDVVEPVEAQPVLGHVMAFTRRADGGFDMIMAYGGVLGVGRRAIAVPVEAVALISPYVTVLDFTPQQLDHFATAPAPTAALGPDEIIAIGLTRPFH